MRHRLRTMATVALLTAMGSGNCWAALIAVDFDGDGAWSGENYESGGFRFSPNSEATITGVNPVYPDEPPSPEWAGYGGTNFFAFQRTGPNPDYLGDDVFDYGSGRLFIDNGGHPFALVSLYGVLVWSHMRITSSKGGDIVIGMPPDPGPFSDCPGALYWCPKIWEFSGPEWVGITWLKFEAPQDIYTGFDHITFRTGLPEPGTLALLGLGLAGLGLSRRRKAA